MSDKQHIEVTVRRATDADILFIAWVNYEASSPEPGFCYWDPLLEGTNTPTMAFIEAMFRARALAWGDPENFSLAVHNGQPIAGASGFEMNAQDYRPLRESRLPYLASLIGWDDSKLNTFRERYAAVWSDPQDISIAPAAQWTIECVATKPEYRGRGAAKQVIRELLDEGQRLGFSHAGISVTVGNESAQRAYEALGFKMYVTYGSEYFNDQYPGTIKYRRRLGNVK